MIDQSLIERLLHRTDPTDALRSMELRTSGFISDVYALTTNRGGRILKVYPADAGWKRTKELHVFGLLRDETEVPVPRVVDSGGAGELLDRDWILMEILPGTELDDRPDAGPEARRNMGKMLRRIHTVRFPEFGYINGETIGRPNGSNRGYMAFRFREKIRLYRKRGGDAALADAIEARAAAETHLFDCPEAVLCHNDYREGNILVDAEGAITGVLDVENALAGDPLLDIAKYEFYSVHEGEEWKLEAFLKGYGPLPKNWRARLDLYRLYHILELRDFLARTAAPDVLVRLDADLRKAVGAERRENG